MPEFLFDNHRRELEIESAIDPKVIRERGYRSAGRPGPADERSRDELKAAGIPGWAIRENWNFPGLIIPWHRATGEQTGIQFKPASPISHDGKRMKYASPKGRASTLDVHPRWTRLDPAIVPAIRDTSRPLHITEGIKKADSLTSRGLVTVALNGVFNWRSQLGTLGDWEDIPLRGRTVVLVFDADTTTNRMVLAAMKRLGAWVRSKGATARYVIPPAQRDGVDTKGIDDWFAAGGTWNELDQATRPPELAGQVADRFTEAAMAEEVAAEALAGEYCHTAGLGWLHYTGTHWQPVEDKTVVEEIRHHFRSELLAALDRQKKAIAAGNDAAAGRAAADVTGWMTFQTANRISNVLKLTRGVGPVSRSAGEFDTDPDVLNTPGGLLHLDTLIVEPHSPDHLVTKITTVSYRPEADHEAFKTALEAIPDGAETYLQTIIGQALTGHPSKQLLMNSGGGSNGKTALLGTFHAALGGYAMLVPNELLLAGATKGAATPEKMTLRGLRLAYIEETPEEKYLNVQALKALVDTPVVSGRHLFKDITEFRSSHSIILNTNYPPQVVETDHGTWRRLANIHYPHRFRIDGDGHGEWKPGDRAGDATVKDRLSERGALEAALAWAVQGAALWYAQRTPEVPPVVQEATRAWRHASDNVLRFLDETVVFDTESWVTTADLYRQFSEWSRARGVGMASETTFMGRLTGHTGLEGPIEVVRRRFSQAGLSRPVWAGSDADPSTRARAVAGIRFKKHGE